VFGAIRAAVDSRLSTSSRAAEATPAKSAPRPLKIIIAGAPGGFPWSARLTYTRGGMEPFGLGMGRMWVGG
jgi:hypothetical protein